MVKDNATNGEMYLPALTKWYKFGPEFDTKPFEYGIDGGQTLYNYPAPLHDSPMFVREGTVLPTPYTRDGVTKSVNTYSAEDPLGFEIFPL